MGTKRVLKALAVALAIWALPAALLLLASAALADDSSMGSEGGSGGSLRPIWTTNVRMAAETVQAVCFGPFAEYRVDFEFVNDGKAHRIKLGFPFSALSSGNIESDMPIGFQAWQNGRPLTVKAVHVQGPYGSSAGYFMHEAVFPHGATMITVSYLAYPGSNWNPRRRGVNPKDERNAVTGHYDYWLHTGATWKGPIGAAVVRYRLADSFGGTDVSLTADHAHRGATLTSPPGWTKPLPRTFQWRFSDFEPGPVRQSNWFQQSPYDVTLAFANAPRHTPTDAKWTWSSVATGFEVPKSGTVWAEGVPGTGAGEWLQATFKRPTRLRELRIVPGNMITDATFRQFARPRVVRAIFSDGSSTLLTFKDSLTLQRFPVDVTTRSVRFVIRSVYRGTDYPATCIGLVEFGRERAPGFVPFAKLINDPYATGRLTAWAGPPAPAPKKRVRMDPSLDQYAGGDLIGINEWATYPGDAAPFLQSSSLAAMYARDPDASLPDPNLVGTMTAVNALSSWTFEIRFSSGIDLYVNTRLSLWRPVSVPKALVSASMYGGSGYTDGRRNPFDVISVGRQIVGVARAGELTDYSAYGSGGDTVPAQMFWREGDTSYHLYARSDTVTLDDLAAAARSMIASAAYGDLMSEAAMPPATPSPTPSATASSSPVSLTSSARVRWFGFGAGVGVAAALVVLFVAWNLWKRRRATSPTESGVPTPPLES